MGGLWQRDAVDQPRVSRLAASQGQAEAHTPAMRPQRCVFVVACVAALLDWTQAQNAPNQQAASLDNKDSTQHMPSQEDKLKMAKVEWKDAYDSTVAPGKLKTKIVKLPDAS